VLVAAEVGWYREFTRPYTMGTSFLCLKIVVELIKFSLWMQKTRRESTMNQQVDKKVFNVEDIIIASHNIKDEIAPTPLQYNHCYQNDMDAMST